MGRNNRNEPLPQDVMGTMGGADVMGQGEGQVCDGNKGRGRCDGSRGGADVMGQGEGQVCDGNKGRGVCDGVKERGRCVMGMRGQLV